MLKMGGVNETRRRRLQRLRDRWQVGWGDEAVGAYRSSKTVEMAGKL
jgi:hypothetical protein